MELALMAVDMDADLSPKTTVKPWSASSLAHCSFSALNRCSAAGFSCSATSCQLWSEKVNIRSRSFPKDLVTLEFSSIQDSDWSRLATIPATLGSDWAISSKY